MTAAQRLAAYEAMEADLQREYDQAVETMAALKAQGKEKTVTFRSLLARKLTLREWLDTYERYGL